MIFAENVTVPTNVGQMNNSTVWAPVEGEHKLQTPWSFWYDKGQHQHTKDAEKYRAMLIKLGSFDTVESFWKMYLHMKRPSALEHNVNLYLFRDGANIAPMWECFPHGGCWILKVKKRKDSGISVLGKLWQDLVLAAVGEAFEEPDVVGVSVCIRRNEDLLCVWNADSRNKQIQFGIGEKMKQVLELEPSTIINYKHHFQSLQDYSSFKNAKAYVFAACESQPHTGATSSQTAGEAEKSEKPSA